MKKILLITSILSIFAFSAFLNLEPSPMLAASMGDQFATFLTVNAEISLTDCSNITMNPNIGLSQDSAVGTTTCSVETSNATGYIVQVSASTTPALKNATYSPFSDVSTSTNPATWVGPTNTNTFGYSLYGFDVATAIWGTDRTSCGSAAPTGLTASNRNWYGFWTTATTVIDRDTASTSSMPFIFCVGAEQGSATSVPSGVYTATTTLTAITQ